jgi:hypothetical protein
MLDGMMSHYGAVFTVMLPGEVSLQERVEELGVATLLVDYHWCARKRHVVAKVTSKTSWSPGAHCLWPETQRGA